MRTVILIAVFAVVSTLLGAETGAELRAKGVEILRASQADPDQIVVAAKLLAKAADAFVAEGNEDGALEVNACLYWVKKKMTIQQMDKFLASGNGEAKATVAKLEAVVEKKVEVSQSKEWLARADGYAKGQKDGFLAAVRYFEVASRFKGTPEGEVALEKSLKFLQQAKVAQDPNRDVGRAEKGEGKVYVQSYPRGASILVRQNGELRDTGARTPSLVKLPKGPTTLVLRKDRYADSVVKAVAGDAIVKTEVVRLEPPKYDVEVTVSAEMGDGWMIFVDRNPCKDKTGKIAIAPCTISVTSGRHVLSVAKTGFKDPSPTRFEVKDGAASPIEINNRPMKGSSAIMAWYRRVCLPKKYIGTWIKIGTQTAFELKEGNVVVAPFAKNRKYVKGTWKVVNQSVVFSFSGEVIELKIEGDDLLKGMWTLKRKSKS